MPVMNIIEAVRDALRTQMRLDSRVVVLHAVDDPPRADAHPE